MSQAGYHSALHSVKCEVSAALLFVSWLAVSSGEAVVKCFVASGSSGEAQGRGKLLGSGPCSEEF